jgi:hypothetical protein
LTHQVLWALTERLLDTTTFNEELQPIQTQLKITDWQKFRGFRNNILYDGGFWPSYNDMPSCDLIKGIPNPQMIEAALLKSNSSSSPFAGEYFATASLFRAIIAGMFQTIADVAPALKVEVDAFNALGPANA